MKTTESIAGYIAGLAESKRSEIERLHELILRIEPGCRLWFLDGKDATGKVVTNPNIGYGAYSIRYADGKSREFYRIGLSANKTGISVYVMGIADKKYLAEAFGKSIGKATVTGYCIRFKRLENVDLKVLETAIRYGFESGAG